MTLLILSHVCVCHLQLLHRPEFVCDCLVTAQKTHTHTQTHTYTNTHIHKQTCTHTHIHTRIHAHTCKAHAHTHAHSCIHTHTHVYTHTHVQLTLTCMHTHAYIGAPQTTKCGPMTRLWWPRPLWMAWKPVAAQQSQQSLSTQQVGMTKGITGLEGVLETKPALHINAACKMEQREKGVCLCVCVCVCVRLTCNWPCTADVKIRRPRK